MLYKFVCREAHEELENMMGLLSLCFWGISGNKVKTVVMSTMKIIKKMHYVD
jgi:hypothetical protein